MNVTWKDEKKTGASSTNEPIHQTPANLPSSPPLSNETTAGHKRPRHVSSTPPLLHDAFPLLSPDFSRFKQQKHSLRISVSEVAACSGFHPFRCLIELMQRHIYQGSAGQLLLQHDAQLLGLGLVNDDDLLLDIAQQAGGETHRAFEQARQVKTGESQMVKTIEQAEALREKVVSEAKKSKKITKEQLEALGEGTRHSLYTGFGTTWESDALDLFESRYGSSVHHRNQDVLTWRFDNQAVPLGKATTKTRSLFIKRKDTTPVKKREHVNMMRKMQGMTQTSEKPTSETTSIDLTVESSSRSSSKEEADEEHPPERKDKKQAELVEVQKQACYFCLRGSVDGIRDELAPASTRTKSGVNDNDDDSWVLQDVIVECKHRMKRFQPSPPIYEMIQATTYCLMYQVKDCDLLQVLRRSKPKATPPKFVPKDNKIADEKKIDDYFQKSTGMKPKNAALTNTNADVPHNGTIEETSAEKSGDVKASEAKVFETAKERSNDGNSPLSNGSSTFSAITTDSTAVSKKATSTDSSEISEEIQLEISVQRVQVDDPVLKHGENWNSVVLPRLCSWVNAVYTIRSDDDRRYRYLVEASSASRVLSSNRPNPPGNQQQAWEMLVELCPWLKDCRTAHNS